MVVWLYLLTFCAAAGPLPLIDPEFSGGLDAWLVTTEGTTDSCLLPDGGGTPDTTAGKCLRLVSGTSIETRAPILRSMDADQSLHVWVSLKGVVQDSSVRFELVDASGQVHCGRKILPLESWSRYRIALVSKNASSGPLRLRIIRATGSGELLLDNLALELVTPLGEEYRSLFDGRTLAGWIGDKAGYVVEDGEIRVKSGTGGDLRTRSQFDDFELQFDFRLEPGANNGIAVRAPVEGDAAYEGIEIQVIDNFSSSNAKLKPWQYHGSAYGLIPAKRGWMLPPGQWNRQTIRLVGRRLTVTLNGHVILDGNLDDSLRDGALSGAEHPGAIRSSGHIGFCGHGSEMAFRNLMIRPIGQAPDQVKVINSSP